MNNTHEIDANLIEKSSFTNTTKRILRSGNTGLLIALGAIIVIFSVLTGNKYFTRDNIINILISSSIVGMVAIGECYLIITGHIDLSPGSVAAFSGVFVALLLDANIPFLLAILIVVITGLGIGYINSLLVNKLKLEAFIATLATMSIFRGLAYIICNGKAVFITNKSFLYLGAGRIAGIPIPVIIFLIAFSVFSVVLSRTQFGRQVYMVGGNAVAARLAGINAQKVRTKLYMMASGFAALGGCILTARMSSGQPMASNGLEFDAVTAVVLGGTAMSGGVGTMGGVLIGLFILQGFNNGLMMMNVPSFWQTVSRGMLLVVALSFDYLRNLKEKK